MRFLCRLATPSRGERTWCGSNDSEVPYNSVMSAVDPFAPGKSLLQYRLVERVTSSVWKAEDTRSGKQVALKILARQLPKDPTKRDTLVREVRQGAALYHSFLANIVEIVTAGDALLLIMEWVDGKPLTTTVRGKALDRAAFFRLAY